MMKSQLRIVLAFAVVASLVLAGCGGGAAPEVTAEGIALTNGSTRVVVAEDGAVTVQRVEEGIPTTLASGEPPVTTVDGETCGYNYDLTSLRRDGNGGWVVNGSLVGVEGIAADLHFSLAPSSLGGVILQTVLSGGQEDVAVESTGLFSATLNAGDFDDDLDAGDFWAFAGGSYPERFDWLVKVDEEFERENFQGMNAADYGGGIPATDVWNAGGGLLVASVSNHWLPIALPIAGGVDGAEIGVNNPVGGVLKSGGQYAEAPLMFLTHEGDAFTGLRAYGEVMRKRGLVFPDPPESAYEPMWCAWGYERRFYPDEILATLPKVADMGYKWAGVDDGFQTYNGDWGLIEEKFPGGDADMSALVDSIHRAGLKAMLWWVPGDADPRSQVVQEHADWVVKNEDGTPAEISWWDSWYLNPTKEGVLDHQRELVDKFLDTWGYDGLKTDGQCFNLVPPDYSNPEADPYAASAHSSDILRVIYEEAKKDKPGAVIHNCPCGTVFSLYNMPYTDQYVSSDPLDSWQIRTKNLVLRAIVGDKIAFYGDHVELSTGGDDFASTVGMAGVPGSKFIWPDQKPVSGDFLLTPERETNQRHWLAVYADEDLARESQYRDLYVLGYDIPETHAFEKSDGTMYYSLYADSFDGEVELRGLKPNVSYTVVDYDRGMDYGSVTGGEATLAVQLEHHLLLKAIPE